MNVFVSDEQDEPADAVSVQADFHSRRALVVADDLRTLLDLTPMLEGWGCEVTGAGDTGEALDVLAEDAGFDIALMDIMMPGMDDPDTLQRLRAGIARGGVPVVALCPSDVDAAEAHCRSFGVDDFLLRPVDAAALKAVLTRLFATGDGSTA